MSGRVPLAAASTSSADVAVSQPSRAAPPATHPMPLSEDNVRLLVGLMATTILLVLIVLSELGHVPLADRSVFLLGSLILGGIGIDIWRGHKHEDGRDDPRRATHDENDNE